MLTRVDNCCQVHIVLLPIGHSQHVVAFLRLGSLRTSFLVHLSIFRPSSMFIIVHHLCGPPSFARSRQICYICAKNFPKTVSIWANTHVASQARILRFSWELELVHPCPQQFGDISLETGNRRKPSRNANVEGSRKATKGNAESAQSHLRCSAPPAPPAPPAPCQGSQKLALQDLAKHSE